MENPIQCKICLAAVEQLSSGTWIDQSGIVYCTKPGAEKTLHEPIVPPDWITHMKTLSQNPFWTPSELARLYQVPEATVEEILHT